MVVSFALPLAGIVLLDLVLSGDNAIAIGVAAAGLPRRQRRWALVIGGVGAIAMRILLSFFASIVLQIPFLQVLGSVAVIYIAIKLLKERSAMQKNTSSEEPERWSLATAMRIIMIADVTMSLDNMLAVGALSAGSWLLLSIGLLVSMTMILLASALIAELLTRLPWLLDLASIVLAWTAATLLLHDKVIGAALLHRFPIAQAGIPTLMILIVLGANGWLRVRCRQQK